MWEEAVAAKRSPSGRKLPEEKDPATKWPTRPSIADVGGKVIKTSRPYKCLRFCRYVPKESVRTFAKTSHFNGMGIAKACGMIFGALFPANASGQSVLVIGPSRKT